MNNKSQNGLFIAALFFLIAVSSSYIFPRMYVANEQALNPFKDLFTNAQIIEQTAQLYKLQTAQLAQVQSATGQVNASQATNASVQVDQLIQTLDKLSTDAANLQTGSNISGAISNGQISGKCVTLTKTLRLNSEDTSDNTDVAKLQTYLKSAKYLDSSVVVSGYFGPATATAVRKFQIDNKVVPADYTEDVQVGPATRAKIKALTCGSSSLSANDISDLGKPDVQPKINPEIAVVKLITPSKAETYSVGKVVLNKSVNVPLKLSVSGGQATYVSAKGLNDIFNFAGGSFPGKDGTCTAALTDGCSIVFSMTPQTSAGVKSADSLIYSTDVSLSFTSEGQTGSTNAVRLGGKTEPLATASAQFTDPGPNIDILMGNNATVVRANFLLVGNPTNIKVIPADAPFSAKLNCEPSNATVGSLAITNCLATYTINANKVGSYTLNYGLTFFDGEKTVSTNQNPITVRVFSGSDFSVTPENNLLVVYNQANTESKKIAEYYIANRPGFSAANVLAISYPDPSCSTTCGQNDDEIARIPAYKTAIERPIQNWLDSHPEKDIRAIVIVRGIPTRVYTNEPPRERTSSTDANTIALGALLENAGSNGANCISFDYGYPNSPDAKKPYCKSAADNSAGFFTKARYPDARGLVTYLDMGTYAQTIAYIDKLKSVYSAMKNPGLFISAKNAGLAGSTYYIEDVIGNGSTLTPTKGQDVKNNILQYNQSANIDYRSPKSTALGKNLSDVAGFFTWGTNSFRGKDYTWDGQFNFTGKSNWFLIQTVESFNGMRNGGQGNFDIWFHQKAFGGNNFERTPAAAVVHVDEPGSMGVNNPDYFGCWEAGNAFIDCAWYSRMNPVMMAVGDPWITK